METLRHPSEAVLMKIKYPTNVKLQFVNTKLNFILFPTSNAMYSQGIAFFKMHSNYVTEKFFLILMLFICLTLLTLFTSQI